MTAREVRENPKFIVTANGYTALVAAVSCWSTPSAVGYASTLFTADTAGREPTSSRHVTGKVHATRSPTYSEHTRSDAER